MKKILFLTHNLEIGGVQKSVAMLLNSLATTYECTLLLFEDDKEIRYTLHQAIQIKMIPTKKIDISIKDIGLEIFNYRLHELSCIEQSIKPALIFSYEDYHNILSLSITSSAKRVISSRISLVNIYTNTSAIHLLGADFYLQNIQKLYKKAHAVVCVSQFIQKELLTISSEINAINIYNGIDKKQIDSTLKQKTPLEYKYILHVGRLHPQKGQKDLITAYSKIHTLIEEKLLIIGDGPIKNELQELIDSLGLSQKVLLLGAISQPYHYMKNASFCVLPSYEEGFSNTALEMMYTSSLIATRYNGHDEILKEYGNLVNIADIQALSKLLYHYATDTQHIQRLHKLQKDDVSSFTIQASMHKYHELIKKLINE